MLSCASIAHAAEPSFAQCLAIKDSKQRLSCYDKAAPEVNKQLVELAESRASLINKRNADEDAALKEQQKLVKETLRELRKLSTATEVGLSKVEYSRRVLDVASNVQLNLPEIKNAAVRDKFKEALKAFTDANDFWEGMFRREYVSRFFEIYGSDTAKYGVTLALYPDTHGTFKRLGMGQVLSPVWSSAKAAIDQAEAAQTSK